MLANLFLHYAFDHWMQSNYPSNPFERHADDAVVHCNSEAEAKALKSEIAKRMGQCGLELNPVVRGWIEYYGAFFQSELLFLVHHLDKLICRWVIRKYKKQGSNFKKAENWVKRIKCKAPNYFVHWKLLRA